MAGRLINLGETHGAGQRIIATGRTYGQATGVGAEIPEGGLRDTDAILNAIGINYAVEKHQVNCDGIPVPDAFAIRRADTKAPFAGTVGARHELLQNREMVEFGQSLIDVADGDLVAEAGGYLKNGAVPWVQFRIPGDILIRSNELGDDVVQPFIWLLNAHVGEASFMAQFTANMPFCNNQTPGLIGSATKQAREKFKGATKIKHTKNMRDRMAVARRVLQDALGYFEEHAREMRELDDIAMNAREMAAFAEELIGSIAETEELTARTRSFREARVDRLNHLFQDGLGCVGRTRLDAYKAVTEMADHHVSRHNEESRFRAIVLGEGDELKGRSLRRLLKR